MNKTERNIYLITGYTASATVFVINAYCAIVYQFHVNTFSLGLMVGLSVALFISNKTFKKMQKETAKMIELFEADLRVFKAVVAFQEKEQAKQTIDEFKNC